MNNTFVLLGDQVEIKSLLPNTYSKFLVQLQVGQNVTDGWRPPIPRLGAL